MIREINASEITKTVREMCIKVNHFLSEDMDNALKKATENEKSDLGKKILDQLQENLKIAGEDMIPICQDTGMAVLFVEVGQDVHVADGLIEDAINEGVRQGYVDGYLRKSVVKDPIIRENTKDNTPAVIHYSIVSGDNVKITFAPKGFGSENMSRVFMLKPADVRARLGMFLSFQTPEEIPGITLENFLRTAQGAVTRQPVKVMAFRHELARQMQALQKVPRR